MFYKQAYILWVGFKTFFFLKTNSHYYYLMGISHTHQTEWWPPLIIMKKIIPLYFSSHMTNILQPLNRYCFGNAEIQFRRKIFHDLGVDLSLIKAKFLEACMRIRNQTYSPKTIIADWKRFRLLENSLEVALAEYKRQIHHNIVMPQNSS